MHKVNMFPMQIAKVSIRILRYNFMENSYHVMCVCSQAIRHFCIFHISAQFSLASKIYSGSGSVCITITETTTEQEETNKGWVVLEFHSVFHLAEGFYFELKPWA